MGWVHGCTRPQTRPSLTGLKARYGSIWEPILHTSKRLANPSGRRSLPDRTAPHGVVGELTHFVDCIREDKTPLIDGRGGRHAVEVVLATYRSAKEKSKVILPMQDL